ncbi:MAG: TonB-dependent receptor [Burkholderiales bacterium]|nr:TonB-dependent receptor [Burkholderiales bacterium]
MRVHAKPMVTAISMALMAVSAAVNAQTPADTPAKKDDTQSIDKIEVTGIRASLEKSIAVKKDAATNVEVVTAEDVGKIPDKNIADALSRLSGVNVQYGLALAMDEAERVAIRGTSPNLNLVTINGHSLSSGDWHVGDQAAASGRSVGFGLMPSQLIGQAIVYKTGQADIPDGGIAGTIDIITRKPLSFKKSLSGEVALGAVHASLAKETDPQVSGLVAWKNDTNTFGVLLQGFKEDRHLRRDGQETFSYGIITAAQAAASGDPSLAGKRMPGSLNSALFIGERKREGGYIGLQARPTSDLEFNLSAFTATLRANNYNSSPFALPTTVVAGGGRITNYTVSGDVITSATILPPTVRNTQSFEYDNYVREGAKSTSEFYDFDAKWRITNDLTLKARVGFTEGSGVTNTQPGALFSIYDAGITYRLNGGSPPDWSVNGVDLRNQMNGRYLLNTNSVAAKAKSTDKENYAHVDGEYAVNWGVLSNFKFGARQSDHERSYEVAAGRLNNLDPVPGCVAGVACNYPPATWPVPNGFYPSNYASGLSGNFPRDLFRFDANTLIAWGNANANWDPVLNKVWTSASTVKEKNTAGYLMTEFDIDKITGNFGVRAVKTEVTSLFYQALTGKCAAYLPPAAPPGCSVPGAITSARGVPVVAQQVTSSNTDYLPSLNVRWDLGNGAIGRLALSKTLGRPNYGELAGSVVLNNTLLTGTGGNPNLKPILSNNVDASIAWYMATRAYVSAGVFAQDLKNYVKVGTAPVELINIDTGLPAVYTVTSRIGKNAKIKGFELAGETPVGGGFGVLANVTYVDGKDEDGLALLGTSKWTYNVRGYYEDAKLSASLAWNYRNAYPYFFQGNGTNTPGNGARYFAGAGSLAASLGYRITENMSVHLDANNLNNPIRYTYHINRDAPAAFYENGRQYFATLRVKF